MDWYLPAICEMGYNKNSSLTSCGSSSQPTVQNIQRLYDSKQLVFTKGYYWSSTVSSIMQSTWGQNQAWFQIFSKDLQEQYPIDKAYMSQISCSQALTF
jgi:hypothetical protein